MAEVARINLRYSATCAEIIGIDILDAPTPVSLFLPTPNCTGAWLTVLDAEGNEIFHQPLLDPFIGGELFYSNGAMKRSKQRPGSHFASVEVPWPGPGARILVRTREVARQQSGALTATTLISEIPSLSLEGAGASSDPTISSVLREFRRKSVKQFARTVDHRWGHENPKALTLAFMPEGFLVSEMALFHRQVDIVIKLFEQTEPYRTLLQGLKVARIEIPSEDNKIGSSTGRTFFKARFTSDRVIEIDEHIAAETISDYFGRQSAHGLIAVNTTDYGGSGGAAAVFSCEPKLSAHIALHELGHSHFGLADEYSAPGQAATTDPVEENVCSDYQRERLKWKHLVSQNTPLPTWKVGNPKWNPADKTIGAFEGAKYQVGRIWRPAFNCKMREIWVEFCARCQEIIRCKLESRLP